MLKEVPKNFGRDLVRASATNDPDADPRDVLTEFDRKVLGASSVTVKLPLRDPVEVKRHLAMMEEACRILRLQMERSMPDRTHLFAVRGVMRTLNQKMNAFRKPRID